MSGGPHRQWGKDEVDRADWPWALLNSVRPGGHPVAGFMAGLRRYPLRAGRNLPAYLVDVDTIEGVFGSLTDNLTTARLPPDQAHD
jgi:hypothetical protein